MKIAVYTIALNEEKFVERWYNSAKDEADYIFIADTGSTDQTVPIAESLGIHVGQVRVRPFRFDVARNASLAMLPDDIDICIQLDMDEVLRPGWRKEIEKAFEKGATKIGYEYIWSWNSDGTPSYTFRAAKTHARFGYVWRNAAHELIYADRIEEKFVESGMVIEHHPDQTKSRSQYFGMLEQDVRENPYSDRAAYYLGREYMFGAEPVKASKEFRRHLGLPSAWWAPERSTSMRWLAKVEPNMAEIWLRLASEQSPNRREPMVDLADYFHIKKDWAQCLEWALKALELKKPNLEYAIEADAWGYKPYDLAALAYFYLGETAKAIEYGQLALEHGTSDQRPRLEGNMAYYRGEK